MSCRAHGNSPSGTRDGFTLLEIVAAVAIFALSASVLLVAIGNAYSAQEAFCKRDNLHEDRREILRQIIALSQNDSAKLDAGGDYRTDSGEEIRWESRAEETEQAGLFRLTTEIDWRGNAGKETFVFYTFRPAWKTQFNNQNSLLENLREAFPRDRFD